MTSTVVTPTVVRALELLKDHFVILTTSRAEKTSHTSFLGNFGKVTVEPLARVDSLWLFHRLTDALQLQNRSDGSWEWIQNKICDTSEGNPRMIMELAERIRREPVIDAYVVDEICNSYLGRQTREIDASPFLLLAFSGLIVLKYIGRETGAAAYIYGQHCAGDTDVWPVFLRESKADKVVRVYVTFTLPY